MMVTDLGVSGGGPENEEVGERILFERTVLGSAFVANGPHKLLELEQGSVVTLLYVSD